MVERLIVELGAEQTPRINVYNKSDLYQGDILPHGEGIVSISARTGEGLDRLLAMIGTQVDQGTRRVIIHLPYDKGGILDMLYRDAKVESVEYAESIEVTAICTPKTLGQLEQYIVEGWSRPKEPWED